MPSVEKTMRTSTGKQLREINKLNQTGSWTTEISSEKIQEVNTIGNAVRPHAVLKDVLIKKMDLDSSVRSISPQFQLFDGLFFLT